jgi:hypothetical protein
MLNVIVPSVTIKSIRLSVVVVMLSVVAPFCKLERFILIFSIDELFKTTQITIYILFVRLMEGWITPTDTRIT